MMDILKNIFNRKRTLKSLPDPDYSVHITRKVDWKDTDGDNISIEDWIAYVDGDNAFIKANGIESDTIYGKFRYKIEGLSILKQHTKKRLLVRNTLFFYLNGNVEVYNPDEDALEKAVFIAFTLGAKVQGDKGEIYHQGMFSDKTPPFDVLYRSYQ